MTSIFLVEERLVAARVTDIFCVPGLINSAIPDDEGDNTKACVCMR
ncbi:hypothetical protein N9C62_06125 [Luminiphilus sp.]|nr:hypothetical protein [Luminiphilus sp.]